MSMPFRAYYATSMPSHSNLRLLKQTAKIIFQQLILHQSMQILNIYLLVSISFDLSEKYNL